MERVGNRISIDIKKNGAYIESREFEEGTPLFKIAELYDNDKECRILIANNGRKIQELHKPLSAQDKFLDFYTLENYEGYRTLERALVYLFVRAACELFGMESYIKVEHSLDKGLYCEVDPYIGRIEDSSAGKIKEKMDKIVAADEPFEKFELPIEEAKKALGTQYDPPKMELLNYRTKSTVNIYRCGWLWDYFYGALPVSAGYVSKFDVKRVENGFLIRMPLMEEPKQLPEFKHDRMLYEIFKETHHWMDLIQVPYVAQLNKTIERGTYRRVIQVSEALHEKKIAQIADSIQSTKKRIVLIAGPSSSGKTSFAQRLSVQLNVHGIKVVTLSTDDYFIDREFVEKDENGKYKFEDLEAVDIKLFNEQLNMLLNGEEVDIPVYDFISGKKVFGKRITKMKPNETIIIEGIHGLNEKLTEGIRAKDKFKIYISPLTSLGVDAHNRIPTSDARLFRRLVRDHRTRGKSALDTLSSWADVRAGEEKNIFPYQEEADVMFNSALPYELAVLKKYAKPVLEEVSEDAPEYITAQKLLKLLSYFVELPDESAILNNSLLKEFIGGTCLFEE
ncbi:MAG: nucleoside kinase [Firmicutes bacterium]|nr:nucleoside kinase [Bacillota bacterium]